VRRARSNARGWALAAALIAVAGCAPTSGESSVAAEDADAASGSGGAKGIYIIPAADTAGRARAIFAGGCFWCIETAYEDVEGVSTVVSGYVGGEERNPTYDQVSSGMTGHAEAVLVAFDPKVVSYERLLEIFWVNHDPTVKDRQFCDHGRQYRPGIFYLDDAQRRKAEASVAWAKSHARFKQPIVTEITPAKAFWPAETYHQDFYRKDPLRYRSYRLGCGRDARLAELWGKAPTGH
jgi:peptide-methionine (S)-S-oxide reductase